MLRSMVRRSAATQTFSALVSLLERLPPQANRLTVLTYHRVSPIDVADRLAPNLVSATPAQFAAQMEYVATACRPIHAEELLAAREGATLPRRAVLVTFDDAYRDFADHALPVLQRWRVPVVLFVPTAYPGSTAPFWWDELQRWLTSLKLPATIPTPRGLVRVEDASHVESAHRHLSAMVKSLPHAEAMAWFHATVAQRGRLLPASVLGWDELRRIAGLGVTLAPHSRTHPRLDRLDEHAIQREVVESRGELEEGIGMAAAPLFAYPDGGYDVRVLTAVARAGYRAAFTTRRGTNSLERADWLRLRRINVGRRTPLPLVRAQLAAPAFAGWGSVPALPGGSHGS